MSLARANEFITHLRVNVPGNTNADFGWTRDQVYAEAKAGDYGLTIREVYENILKGPKNRVLSYKTGKRTGRYYPELLPEEVILEARGISKPRPATKPILIEDDLLLDESIDHYDESLELFDDSFEVELTDDDLAEGAEWDSAPAFDEIESSEFDYDYE